VGVVGSMTHCAGYRAAAVARARDVVTIGIDAEPHAVLPDGVPLTGRWLGFEDAELVVAAVALLPPTGR